MSDDLVDIEINGRALRARKGAMIIEVADEAGLLIPRFCYHKKLSVAANCRMCLVEVEKAPKPLPACATPIMDGMKVRTKSPLAIRAQKSVMEFLLINHPLDCPICDQGGECELQDLAMGYGRGVSRFVERKRVVEDKDLGPLISTDMTRCIHCTRCVRFGEEIGGLPELGLTGRGEDVRIGTFVERNMDSELSGNVIDVCPVGALTSKPFRYRARTWEIQQRDTVSPHDAVGSNLHVHTKNGKVVRVVPRENESVNEVWLADRDRFSYEALYSEERVLTPWVKRDGKWHETDWAEAIEAAASGLRESLSRHGPERLGALVSPTATTEEAYLLQRLVRGLGSSNVDHRLRRCDFRGEADEPVMPLLGTTLSALETNDATLLIGSDCRREQPLVNHRLRKSVLKGGKVCVVNSVDYEFNYDLEARIVRDPASLVRALAEIAASLGVSGGCVSGVESSAEARRIAAVLEGADQRSVLVGCAAIASPFAAEIRALAGAIAARAGASLGFLTEGPNAAGAALAGALPRRTLGGHPVGQPGLNAAAMLEQGLETWIVFGLEPARDCHDPRAAQAAMEAADFVVSLCAHAGPELWTAADVILPLAPFAENAGTYVNVQGDRQTFAEAARPQGDARPGWKVLRVLANGLEVAGFDYVELVQIQAEIEAIEPAGDRDGGDLPQALPDPKQVGLWRLGDVPIYAVDALVRRAPALQATGLASFRGVQLNRATRESLGLREVEHARVTQNGAGIELPIVEDDTVADGCVRIAGGVEQTARLGPGYGPVELTAP